MATRDDYAKLHKELAKAGAPRMYFAVPPKHLSRRVLSAHTRRGHSAVRRLRKRYLRKEFSLRELRRREAQAWASV